MQSIVKIITYFKKALILVVSVALITSTMSLADNVSEPNPGLTPGPGMTPPPPPSPVVVAPEPLTLTDDAHPDQKPTVETAKRLWNLQDADILSVINEVSLETGKNFVVDPRVSGKITLISSKPLKQTEVYKVFLSVLSMLGYSAIPSGNVIKIVPNMESAEQATKLVSKNHPGMGDEVVVRVIPLENTSAAQLIPILRPMLPQWSNVAAYTPGNVIILVGQAANLERLYNVIQEVDRASNNNIQIIQLHHGSAAQVAVVLNNLQNASRGNGESANVSIAVDERSNSILLGGPKAMRVRMRLLIAQLDSPASASEGNTEVIYLRYLEAKTLAPILSKIAANMLGKGSSQIESSTNNQGVNTSSSSTSISTATNIQAETNTNAIVITAPPTLMQALKSVIAKLDIRPAQVLVEAIIAEIDESNLTSLGIQWGSVTADGTVDTGGEGASVTSFPPLGAGIVGIIPHVQIRAVLSALQNQNGVNILSTPTIMVLDNQKANIEIGQDVPYQTGSYSTPGSPGSPSTIAPFTTNNYKAVTLRLDVTPQINLGASVRLNIKLKNDTLQNPQNPGITPIINTSSINNSVLINSDDILVLGGLISHTNNENINKVPILGDFPLIGPLFQQKTVNQTKKNLMVFIKPIIMTSGDEAMLISHNKYNQIRTIQANYRDDLSTIGDDKDTAKLPPWKNKKDLPTPFGTN